MSEAPGAGTMSGEWHGARMAGAFDEEESQKILEVWSDGMGGGQ